MGVIAAALLAGASLGLSIAVPIGPTSLLCIQRTLSGGLPTGLATGLGVATVHLTYGTVILRWGADLVAAWSNGAVLSLVSGAVLLALAVRVLRSDSVLHVSSERRDSLAASYGSAVVLALANPITPVLFLAAMPALLARGTAPLPMLAAGVFLGSFAWWVVLNTAVSLFRRCVTSQVLNQMNKAAGLLLALLALSLLVRGLDGSTAGRLDNASASGAIGATGQPPGRL
ncbi:Threonine/homoserine/homoserine lactone efflux protein [Methylobacterium sp. UNC378MF]|uniref:LysE family translocator n=1 Tax=Methylobacterium sp. UNC378MF TaxID=1502748 RepID=UPI0008855547|nr:LysE family transporter [Methylobacterium sp. UNC378MF]SDA29096.1 Threonine/homoserine/homoserine lactone efflux protein [Methylobacterium sp. UNC378MF]